MHCSLSDNALSARLAVLSQNHKKRSSDNNEKPILHALWNQNFIY